MSDPFSLKEKKILVTGSSRGIGRAIAGACASREAELHLTDHNSQGLSETISLLNPGSHSSYTADLKSDTDIQNLALQVPQIDGLVLNAGMVKTLPVKFINRSHLEEIFSVNLHGSAVLIQQLLKHKKIKQGCSIVFISSVASLHVQIGNAMYSATKGAVNSFTRSLALELAPKQIRVNAILPGFVETNLLEKSPITPEQLDEHRANFPIGRFGKPDDIAYLCVYLLSDAAEWMTGSLLTIDGGFTIK